MAAQVIQIVRALAPSVRNALPYVLAPVAIVVGYIGFTAEELIGGETRKQRDNAPAVPKLVERQMRRQRELEAQLQASASTAQTVSDGK
eukprot:m.172680 g.172680  ORF g.172680 m.172680 type:complete len:89 (+) comp13567_c0_seq1:119-385(+)